MGWFRYMTQLQGYVWRPSERLQAKLDDAMRVTGLTEALNAGPVIGMHIRHGDACGDDYRVRGRLCAPLKKYMEFADLLRAQTGASTIYLATDSKFVLNDTKRFPEYKVRPSSLPQISCVLLSIVGANSRIFVPYACAVPELASLDRVQAEAQVGVEHKNAELGYCLQ